MPEAEEIVIVPALDTPLKLTLQLVLHEAESVPPCESAKDRVTFVLVVTLTVIRLMLRDVEQSVTLLPRRMQPLALGVLVEVGEGEAVKVGVEVKVAVGDGVLVNVAVAVLVGVLVGVIDGV